MWRQELSGCQCLIMEMQMDDPIDRQLALPKTFSRRLTPSLRFSCLLAINVTIPLKVPPAACTHHPKIKYQDEFNLRHVSRGGQTTPTAYGGLFTRCPWKLNAALTPTLHIGTQGGRCHIFLTGQISALAPAARSANLTFHALLVN